MDQSILYVDIENLQDIAQKAVKAAIDQWPEDFPRPGIVNLYARADQTDLWRMWASHAIPSFEVIVKGVQHYTVTGSKNSADLFLALDSLVDLLKGKTRHIAILSDDSDYATLYNAVKQEIGPMENPKMLFKWFMTNRSDTRSPMLTDFFPSEYIHTVICVPTEKKPKEHIQKVLLPQKPKPVVTESRSSESENIAKAIIQNTPVGPFKSTDCKKIIKQILPEHALNKAGNAAFGTQFTKDIWPILQKYGVQLPNPNRKPRKYEMTAEAKGKVGT